jgi:hypothetical protein
MGPFEMVVGIVFIGAVTSTIQELAKRRDRKADKRLLDEMSALRDEVARLRQQHADTVLSFDSSISRMEKRLEYVETRVQLPAGESQQVVGRMG